MRTALPRTTAGVKNEIPRTITSAKPSVTYSQAIHALPAQYKNKTSNAAGGFHGVMLRCPIGCM